MNELSLLTEENVPRSLLIITDGFEVTWKCSSWVSAAERGLIALWKRVDGPLSRTTYSQTSSVDLPFLFFLIKILVT